MAVIYLPKALMLCYLQKDARAQAKPKREASRACRNRVARGRMVFRIRLIVYTCNLSKGFFAMAGSTPLLPLSGVLFLFAFPRRRKLG
jgi:hypothetical protein